MENDVPPPPPNPPPPPSIALSCLRKPPGSKPERSKQPVEIHPRVLHIPSAASWRSLCIWFGVLPLVCHYRQGAGGRYLLHLRCRLRLRHLRLRSWTTPAERPATRKGTGLSPHIDHATIAVTR